MKDDTLTGDIRDMLLTHIRSMETPWSKLSEREQGEKIDACRRAAENAVRGAVQTVAHKGFPHLIVSTGKWTVKDGIKLEVVASSTVDNITHLAEHGGAAAVLVLCEAGQFFGEQKPVTPDPDQPDMLADGEGDDQEDEQAGIGDSVEVEEDAAPIEVVIADEAIRKGRNSRAKAA